MSKNCPDLLRSQIYIKWTVYTNFRPNSLTISTKSYFLAYFYIKTPETKSSLVLKRPGIIQGHHVDHLASSCIPDAAYQFQDHRFIGSGEKIL